MSQFQFGITSFIASVLFISQGYILLDIGQQSSNELSGYCQDKSYINSFIREIDDQYTQLANYLCTSKCKCPTLDQSKWSDKNLSLIGYDFTGSTLSITDCLAGYPFKYSENINAIIKELENEKSCSGICAYQVQEDQPYSAVASAQKSNTIFKRQTFSAFYLFSDLTKGPPTQSNSCQSAIQDMIDYQLKGSGITFLLSGVFLAFGWLLTIAMYYQEYHKYSGKGGGIEELEKIGFLKLDKLSYIDYLERRREGKNKKQIQK
eukprot:403361030